jgi:hypothetical protein
VFSIKKQRHIAQENRGIRTVARLDDMPYIARKEEGIDVETIFVFWVGERGITLDMDMPYGNIAELRSPFNEGIY